MILDKFREHPVRIVSKIFYATLFDGLRKLRRGRSRIGSCSELGERRILDEILYRDDLVREREQREMQVLQIEREIGNKWKETEPWASFQREQASLEAGCYVAEAVVFYKGGERFLLRRSPLVAFPETLRDSRNYLGLEFFANDEQVEMIERLRRASESCIELPEQTVQIPIEDFETNTITVFLYGGAERAREQGKLLKRFSVERVPLWLPRVEWVDDKVGDMGRPIVRQLKINGLMADGAIGGNWIGLSNSQAIFGVSYKNPSDVYDDPEFLARWIEPPGRIARLCDGGGVHLYDEALKKYRVELLQRPDLQKDTRRYLERLAA